MVKLIAFHLPQYYSFHENDLWWGKGFTDWVNIKKAKAYYKGHYQPKVPIDGYYSMIDKKTHLRQAELAKKYGIYGFCYYHYWFNGKMLMEKPLEMILEEKDIDLPFCMCWANEPWTKSWDGKNKEVIMPQYYGDKEDWYKHINYLLPFFKDRRYIKVNNKPVFVLYRTNNIPKCDDIISCWDEECKNAGFDGIYIIEERNNFQHESNCSLASATLDFEPGYTRSFDKTIIEKVQNKILQFVGRRYSTFSYVDTCNHIISRSIDENDGKKHYLGMFTGWDNTPRRKSGGAVSLGANPKNFGRFLSKQISRSNSIDNEFLFINAWNEWAEGAYLEADSFNQYGMLDAVKEAIQNA